MTRSGVKTAIYHSQILGNTHYIHSFKTNYAQVNPNVFSPDFPAYHMSLSDAGR